MECTNLSVRRLDLEEATFGDGQCVQLCCSSLGQQCEILLITVRNRNNVLYLVNNMSRLQALNVKGIDTERRNNPNSMSQNEEGLHEWLHRQLPSTCMIRTDGRYNYRAQLWIC